MLRPWADRLSTGAKALGERVNDIKEMMAEKLRDQPGVDGNGMIMVADSRSFKASLCGYDIEGVSIAGQETCIIIPRCKIAFDIGRCPQRAVQQQTVLLSHGHLDHIGGLPFHVASRDMIGAPAPKYVMPPHLEAPTKQLLDAAWQISASAPLPYEIIPLGAGQEYKLPSGYMARPFPTVHRVPSQGYILYSQRKKLKAELQGKSQEEIKAARQEGQEVTDTFEVAEIAFTGDTSGELLEQSGLEDMFKARLLIMELTFIDDAVSVDMARDRGHMHIADFVAHAHKFQNEAILLIHMSKRYRRNEIITALDTSLPPALRAKCVPFLNGFD